MATPQEALIYNRGNIYSFAGYYVLQGTSITAAVTLETTKETTGFWLVNADTTLGAFSITLPPVANCYEGLAYHFVDNKSTGSFGANNLTILGNGALINGAASLVLNTNFASVQLRFNGTSWIVFTKA